MYSFASCFCSVWCLGDVFVWFHTAEVCPFFLLPPYVYHSLVIHFLVDRLYCSQFLAIMMKVLWTSLYMSFDGYKQSFLLHLFLGVELLALSIVCLFGLSRYSQTGFLSVISNQWCVTVLVPLPHLLKSDVVSFYILAIFVGV